MRQKSALEKKRNIEGIFLKYSGTLTMILAVISALHSLKGLVMRKFTSGFDFYIKEMHKRDSLVIISTDPRGI